MIRSSILALTIVLAAALGMFASRTPASQPVSAPASAFSAERAMKDLRVVARVAHPIGSPENIVVRDYLLGRLRGMGLEVSLRAGRGHWSPRSAPQYVIGGEAESIVAILPGRDRAAPKLALMAHYDSAPNSPGAGDDGAGVVTILETVRALKTQGTPARDVVLLLTDGEEAGLIGASAFFKDDPLARQIGTLINMEARGGGGRTMMFQTGPGNDQMIDVFRRNAAGPTSSSLAVFMYQNMPNDTDFTEALPLKIPGLNFAFVGRERDYHAARATPDSLERGALQHMGDQVLAQTRALAFAKTLPVAGEDVTYSDVLGAFVIAYPPLLGWLPLVLALGLVGFAAVRLRREGRLDWRDLGAGAAASLLTLVLAGLAARLVRGATGIPLGFADIQALLIRFPHFETALVLTALGLVLAVVGLTVKGRARLLGAGVSVVAGLVAWKLGGTPIHAGAGALAAGLSVAAFWGPRKPDGAFIGFLIPLALAAVATQIAAPVIGFLFTWPLLLAGVAAVAIATLGTAEAKPAGLIVAGLLAVLGAGWLLYLGHPLALGLGARMPEPLALIPWLIAPLLFPLIAHARGWALAGGSAIGVAAALTAYIGLANPYSAAFPAWGEVQYVANRDTGGFYRLTSLERPDAWSHAALTGDGGAVEHKPVAPSLKAPVFSAKAKPIAIAAPRAEVERLADGRERLTFDMAGAAQIRVLLTFPKGATDVTIAGRPTSDKWAQPGKDAGVMWNAPKGPLEIVYRAPAAPKVAWTFLTRDWPADATPLPALPDDVRPSAFSNSTLVTGTTLTRR